MKYETYFKVTFFYSKIYVFNSTAYTCLFCQLPPPQEAVFSVCCLTSYAGKPSYAGGKTPINVRYYLQPTIQQVGQMPVCCASDVEAARWNFESARRNGVDCCPLCGEMRMGCAAAAAAAAAAATQAPQPAAMHGATHSQGSYVRWLRL